MSQPNPVPAASSTPVALAIAFPAERLNDGAGDPYWVDFTLEEARQLHAQLAEQRAEPRAAEPAAPLTFTLG